MSYAESSNIISLQILDIPEENESSESEKVYPENVHSTGSIEHGVVVDPVSRSVTCNNFRAATKLERTKKQFS